MKKVNATSTVENKTVRTVDTVEIPITRYELGEDFAQLEIHKKGILVVIPTTEYSKPMRKDQLIYTLEDMIKKLRNSKPEQVLVIPSWKHRNQDYSTDTID